MRKNLTTRIPRGVNHRAAALAAACLIATAALATPAFAAVRAFSGTVTANGAPVSFDAEKRDGRYRTVSNFVAGSHAAQKGVPMSCNRNGNIQVVVEASDTFRVASDGTFRGIGDGGEVIRGKVGDQRAKGTIKIAFTWYQEGEEPDYCQTLEPVAWTATRAG